MIATNHMLAGAALGQQRSLPLALALGLASHFVLDAIPHDDYPPRPLFIGLDLALGAGTLVALGSSPAGMTGALAGIAPDIANRLSWLGPLHNYSDRAHYYLHSSRRPRRRVALLSQLALGSLLAAVVYKRAAPGQARSR